MPGFLWTLRYVPFFFDEIGLHPFTVINHSCENDYMLSPVSFLKKSLNGNGDGGLEDLPHSATFLKYLTMF